MSSSRPLLRLPQALLIIPFFIAVVTTISMIVQGLTEPGWLLPLLGMALGLLPLALVVAGIRRGRLEFIDTSAAELGLWRRLPLPVALAVGAATLAVNWFGSDAISLSMLEGLTELDYEQREFFAWSVALLASAAAYWLSRAAMSRLPRRGP